MSNGYVRIQGDEIFACSECIDKHQLTLLVGQKGLLRVCNFCGKKNARNLCSCKRPLPSKDKRSLLSTVMLGVLIFVFAVVTWALIVFLTALD